MRIWSIKTLLTSKKEPADSEGTLSEARKMEKQYYKKNEELAESKNNDGKRSVISFVSEIPSPLKKAMETFIDSHPSWDQYRLVKAALAGFLIQNGIESRAITRLYIDNMFARESSKRVLL